MSVPADLAWSFDGYGNRTQQSVVKGSGPVMSVAVNGLTNRVIGDSYDLNGNLTATAGGAAYTWDAANRLTQFQTAQVTESYAYDPQNRRVWRRDGAGNEFVGLYGIDGQLANEYGLGNHPPGGVCYWGAGLGNVRLGTHLLWKSTGVEVSDRLGSTAGAGSGFYPYGEAKAGTPASARYATYGRDTTGLHYALNRHYDPRQGRFLSPDPYEASAGPSDPQSWNRYTYVQNDPVNYHDPRGLFRSVPEPPPSRDPDRLPVGGDGMGMEEVIEEIGGGGGGGGYRSRFADCNPSGSEEEDKNLEFLYKYHTEATEMEQETGVPTEWTLAWAAYEGGWGHRNPTRTKALTNGNWYGLRAGRNWIEQATCGPGAIADWACFSSFADSTRSTMLSLRTDPRTGLQWTAAGVLVEEANLGRSAGQAFQRIADLGHDAANRRYGAEAGGVNVSGRLDCLKKNGMLN